MREMAAERLYAFDPDFPVVTTGRHCVTLQNSGVLRVPTVDHSRCSRSLGPTGGSPEVIDRSEFILDIIIHSSCLVSRGSGVHSDDRNGKRHI